MKRVLSVCLLLVLSAPLWGAEVPKLHGPVNDYAEVLSADDEKKLTDFLLGQERKTTNQIVILTVKSLDGNTIKDFAEKVFNTWKLGQKGKDNGILIVLSTGERKMRIEVGHGLEGVLPDVIASRIIRNEMALKFDDKIKDFYGGFMAAAVAIDKAIKGEYTAEESEGWPTWLTIVIIIILVILLILIPIDFSVNGGDAFTLILLSSIISGGGGGYSGGGRGGYSGGGGGSGGGGASGNY